MNDLDFNQLSEIFYIYEDLTPDKLKDLLLTKMDRTKNANAIKKVVRQSKN